MKDKLFKTTLARQNWASKYQYDGETPLETFQRVARALASVEVDSEYWYEKFLDMMIKLDENGDAVGLKNTFGGRITANAGTDYAGTTLMNCFSGTEKFLTKDFGIISFAETVGKEVTVLTEEGWQSATIRPFGVQQLQSVVFRPAQELDISHLKGQKGSTAYRPFRGTYGLSVEVTPDHRWILSDGTETTALRVGDVVPAQVAEVDTTSENYRYGFQHGFVFGGGWRAYSYANGDYKFEVRFFGQKDLQYSSMFDNVKGVDWGGVDAITYVRSPINFKELPTDTDPNYISGFIKGWLAADGSILSDERVELSSTNLKGLRWLQENAPFAGYIATGYRTDYHSEETNLGKRSSLLKRLILSNARNLKFKVVSITPLLREEEVYCAVVPKTATFTLSGGIFSGNCFINGPVKNATISYQRPVPNTDKTIDVTYHTDDTGDNLKNIMLTLLEQAETLKSEGGYGINFGFIRPRGSVIKSIGITHPGVIHYMDIWDKVATVIVMGNNDGYQDTIKNYLDEMGKDASIKMKKQARKGAQMAVLPIWHPDIEEYVRAKQEPGRLTKFNMSVIVDNKFMEAVEADDFYDLHFDGKVYKRIKARELYDLIMKSTYNRAEPGILFYDSMQRNNPLAYLGPLNATNPCGEIGGNPLTSTVCLLGSINLTQYVLDDRSFDWDQLKKDIPIFARALDNVNDLTNNALPQYNWATENVRQYGMGINGLGSALYMMGIAYNSKDAHEFTERVTALKEELTWRTSAELAAEKGPFPAYNENFLTTQWFTEFTKISEETKDLIRKNGVRNGKTTTNPPLGNSSVICDIVSNGIEPVFMTEYQRTYIADTWPKGLTKENIKDILKETKQGDSVAWAGEYNGTNWLYEPHNRGLCITETVRDYGVQWVMDNYPEDYEVQEGLFSLPVEYYMVTTNDLNVMDHINIQEIVQSNMNQSTSKTLNVPNNYDYEEFKNLYMEAWKRGLNGFTTYRAGSMEAVLSQVEESKETKQPDVIKKDLKLPDVFINGDMHIIKREGQKFYMNFSYLPEDSERIFPIALWIQTNNTGDIREANGAVKVLVDLLERFEIDPDLIEVQKEKTKGNGGYMRVAKFVSMCLRHNIPLTNIVAALDRVPEVYVTDLIFAIKKFLSSHIKNGTEIKGVTCSVCGGENVIFESGCTLCRDCGASNCG